MFSVFVVLKCCILLFCLNRMGVNGLSEASSCYLTNPTTHQKRAWKLAWQDEFDSINRTEHEWDIVHESVTCSGNQLKQVSCNVMQNVRLQDGMLALLAQHENHYNYQYTAATITTKRYFTHGRWEFRLAQPVGKALRTAIHTKNENESYWHELGQIDFVSHNNQEGVLFRGVHFADSKTGYQAADQQVISLGDGQAKLSNLSDFHLYGMEWSDKKLCFFFDDKYSTPIWFDDDKRSLTPFHQLRLQIGVGGLYFPKPMPERYDLLEWKCPALIVDFVRIYERDPFSDYDHLPQCHLDIDNKNSQRKILDKICKMAAKDKQKDPITKSELRKNEENYNSNRGLSKKLYLLARKFWLPITITAFLLLFLILMIYIVIQVTRMKRKMNKRLQEEELEEQTYQKYQNQSINLPPLLYPSQQGHQGHKYYEIGQDRSNRYDLDPTSSLFMDDDQYVQLADGGHDYIAMHLQHHGLAHRHYDRDQGEDEYVGRGGGRGGVAKIDQIYDNMHKNKKKY